MWNIEKWKIIAWYPNKMRRYRQLNSKCGDWRWMNFQMQVALVISVTIDQSMFFPVSVKFRSVLFIIVFTNISNYWETSLIETVWFQTGLSTEHAIVKLVHQIYKSFETGNYTLGVFIDLSKVFDTVDHTILIRKFGMYGIKGINLAWFRSCLTNIIQYISLTHGLETDTKDICCGVPQDSILGPLLFLYLNDPHNSSALHPIMFADDTNLVYGHTGLKTLSSLVNQELRNINEWRDANKHSTA